MYGIDVNNQISIAVPQNSLLILFLSKSKFTIAPAKGKRCNMRKRQHSTGTSIQNYDVPRSFNNQTVQWTHEHLASLVAVLSRTSYYGKLHRCAKAVHESGGGFLSFRTSRNYYSFQLVTNGLAISATEGTQTGPLIGTRMHQFLSLVGCTSFRVLQVATRCALARLRDVESTVTLSWFGAPTRLVVQYREVA